MTRLPGEPPPRAAARILARGLLLPAVMGAACVFGFAPFYIWPVPIVALAVLFGVWDRSGSALQAGLSGFAFGLGLFLAGVSWVFVSLHEFGSMPVVLAAIATFLFCAYLAIFPAAAGWAAWRLAPAGPWRRLAAMPAVFVAFEWLRGWLFTGFPWLSIGTSQAPGSPLVGYAPLVGVLGVSLAVALAAALAAACLQSSPWSRSRNRLLAALLVLFVAGGALRMIEWTAPSGAPIPMALLQGNVPQHLKWRDETRVKTLQDYRRMVVEAKARVIVLPETALPAFFDRLPPGYVESLAEHGRESGKEIFLGTVERRLEGDQFAYFNSVVGIGPGSPQSYHKRHLVPFGEFIPPGFRWVLAILQIPLTDFVRGDASQPPLKAAGAAFAVAICYEDIFGEEIIAQLPQANVIVNVSNLAWFGKSFATEQHLQASQMRAIETGRWMVRATNTGVTAAIDERGRVVSRLPQFTTGTLVAPVVPRSGATPFVKWGNAAALLLLAAMIAAAAYARRR